MGDLEGRAALVTGAGKRIGREIALALAAEGARVAVHYRRSRAEAEAVRAAIEDAGGEAVTISADLATVAGGERLVAAAARRLGRLDVLVNSASIFHPTPLEAIDEAAFDRFHTVNLKVPFFCALAAARAMRGNAARERRGKHARRGRKAALHAAPPEEATPGEDGVIINLVDASVETPWPDYVPYQVAKAGLAAATLYLARALAPRVRVNAVSPGPILMPPGAGPADVKRALARVPLRRLGDPGDVAAAVVFLVRTRYLTGVILPVDGGRRLG